jgi:hypothetical protein
MKRNPSKPKKSPPKREIVLSASPQTITARPQAPTVTEAMAKVLLNGDLAALSADEKLQYHDLVCRSLGLNPLTRPFDYIGFQGKVVLYARRDCTEQLRKVHSVSITSSKRSIENDICIFEVTAADKTGRTDTGTGAVNVSGLKGADLANAIKKAETQAKRRATLSICGLGMIDESELSDVSGGAMPLTPAGRVVTLNEPKLSVHEDNYNRREQEGLDKLSPEQRQVLERKMREGSQQPVAPKDSPPGPVARSRGEAGSAAPPPAAAPAKDSPTPQSGKEGAADEAGTSTAAPEILYTWSDPQQTANIAPAAGLTTDVKRLLAKFWQADKKSCILDAESFEGLKFELEKRGIVLRRKP